MRPACPTAHLNTHRFSLVAPVYHYSSFSLASMHHQARPHFSILPHHFQRLFSLFFSASALSVYIASLQHCRSFWREASLSTALTPANKCTLALFHVPSFFATYLHTQTGSSFYSFLSSPTFPSNLKCIQLSLLFRLFYILTLPPLVLACSLEIHVYKHAYRLQG